MDRDFEIITNIQPNLSLFQFECFLEFDLYCSTYSLFIL